MHINGNIIACTRRKLPKEQGNDISKKKQRKIRNNMKIITGNEPHTIKEIRKRYDTLRRLVDNVEGSIISDYRRLKKQLKRIPTSNEVIEIAKNWENHIKCNLITIYKGDCNANTNK